MLDRRYSPEQVSGRLKVLCPGEAAMQVSHETIYPSIYVYPRGELKRELRACLRSGRAVRRRRGRRETRGQIIGAVPIGERPAEAEGRLIPGHHEGDLVMGSRASNSAVGTIVERTTGYLTLLPLPAGRDADAVADAIIEHMSALPAWFARTLTWDRGHELAQHQTSGRRADPRRPGEVVISEQTAARFGLHPGQSLPINLYSRQQASDPRFNPMTRPPLRRVRLTITGVGVFTDEVVQDDIDRIYRILATPALTRRELGCCAAYAWVGLRLDRGDEGVAAVQREYVKLLPRGAPQAFRVTSVVEDQGERAIKPESVAAGVFGLIAALTALVLALQAIRRIIVGGRDERQVLRALGAGPLTIGLDICAGAIGAIGLGIVLAAGVAVAMSPLAPLGQLHRLEPDPGISADWTVLVAGAAILLVVLAGATTVLAYAEAAHRSGGRSELIRRPAVPAAAARLGRASPAPPLR